MKYWLTYSYNSSLDVDTAASQFPNIRLFQSGAIVSSTPYYDFISGISMKWTSPVSSMVRQFSAVCWWYAKTVYQTHGIPLGLVQAAWDNTGIERWSASGALSGCNITKASTDSDFWNSMVNPIINMTIYGAIFYQGETNAGIFFI